MTATLANPRWSPPRQEARALLAWARWRLAVPTDWRPLQLMGTPARGHMIVGDAEQALFSIHWQRLRERAISDGEAWVSGRLERHGVQPEPDAPGARHFSACAWARHVQTLEGKQTTLWFGYSESAQLALGVKINGVLPDDLLAKVERDVLGSLSTTAADADSTWSMYDVGFTVPAGFDLARRHLYAGDVALEFRRGRGETLVLRQVYPGDLALSRRSFERWLEATPFFEHRRPRRRATRFEPWRSASRTGLSGVERRTAKKLKWPLGWCAPRHAVAVAAHDPGLNRLLIAELASAVVPDVAVCERAIAAMNRRAAEGGDA